MAPVAIGRDLADRCWYTTPRRLVPCPYVAPGHPVRRPISSTWSPFDPSPGLLGMAGRPSVHAALARDQASQSSQSTQAGMAGFVPERWWVVGGGLTHKPTTTTTWGGTTHRCGTGRC